MIYIVLFLAAVLADIAYNMYQDKPIPLERARPVRTLRQRCPAQQQNQPCPRRQTVRQVSHDAETATDGQKNGKTPRPRHAQPARTGSHLHRQAETGKSLPVQNRNRNRLGRKRHYQQLRPHRFRNPKPDIPHRNLPTCQQNLHPFRKHLQNR